MPNNLRRLRLARRQTQEEIAEALGTTRNMYVKLESGSRRLSLPWIERAAAMWNIDPGEIVTSRQNGAEPMSPVKLDPTSG